MEKVISKINWDGHEVIYTWLPDKEIAKYSPVTQVYGVCFDSNGNILVINDKRWQIPGGTPENGEKYEETLAREVLEEAQTEIKDIHSLGVQRVDFPGNPNKNEGDLYFQARFIALVTKLNPVQPDPATGRIYERKFVSINEINDFVNWGETGRAMFKDAWNLYRQIKKVDS